MKTHSLAVFAACAAGLLLAGCATDKGAYSGNIQDDNLTQGSVAASSAGGAAVSNDTATFKPTAVLKDDTRSDDSSLLSTRIVFFDYDKSVVREDALPVLLAHAGFLSNNPSINVLLAGHADERGSNEYNLALGQRRADAVRDILASYGVSAGQMETLSFGEEYPRAEGHDEAAWQENRRVEIRYSDE